MKNKLILQEWGFCGWAGNLPKESKVFIRKDAQPWISVDHMTKDFDTKKGKTIRNTRKTNPG
jgi:hypothetical protein